MTYLNIGMPQSWLGQMDDSMKKKKRTTEISDSEQESGGRCSFWMCIDIYY